MKNILPTLKNNDASWNKQLANALWGPPCGQTIKGIDFSGAVFGPKYMAVKSSEINYWWNEMKETTLNSISSIHSFKTLLLHIMKHIQQKNRITKVFQYIHIPPHKTQVNIVPKSISKEIK